MHAKRGELVFPRDVETLAPTEVFLSASAEYGLAYDEGDLAKLGRYLGLLRAGNELANMTAIMQPEEMWMKHIFDSLTLLPMLSELEEGSRIADVGSGAGLPGLPLAVAMPELRFSLIEATAKKAAFIRHAAHEMGLTNVEVLNDRAETLGQDWAQGAGQRERYDAVVARAVGRLSILVELTAPLAKVGGHVLLTKGQKAEEELVEAEAAMDAVGLTYVDTAETSTGRIVVLEKTRRTPKTYPRRPGEPERSPIR